MLSQILDSIFEGIGRCRKKYLVLQITEYAVYCLMYAMISSTNRCLHCLHIKTNKSSFFVVYITVYRNIFVFVKLKVFCGLFLEIKASNNVAVQFFYLICFLERRNQRGLHFCSFLKVLKWIVLRTDRPMCAHQFKKFKLYI